MITSAPASALNRFTLAQRKPYPRILREIQTGRKRTHWMWFVFPQLRALAKSETATYYGIANRDEAVAYLDNPLLRARLAECTISALAHPRLMFPYPDNHKFQACMTLFAQVADDSRLPLAALAKFYGGRQHQLTLDVLDGKPIPVQRSPRPVGWSQPPLIRIPAAHTTAALAMDRAEIEGYLREFNLSDSAARRIAEQWLNDRLRATAIAYDDATRG